MLELSLSYSANSNSFAFIDDTFLLNERAIRNPLNTKRGFEVFRHYHFILNGFFSALPWLYKNRSFFQEAPLFWRKLPSIDRVMKMLVDQISEINSPLINLYCKTAKISHHVLPTHFSQLMKKFGTCHGQALTFIQFLHQEPDVDPMHILKHLSRNPERIYYHQMIEIIRGLLQNESEEILQVIGHLNDQKIVEDFLIKPDVLVYFTFDKSQRVNEFQKIEMILSNESSSTILFKRWNEGDLRSHTILFHRSQSRKWFYNSTMIGLYVYKDIHEMTKKFMEHIDALYPMKSNQRSCILLEIYRAAKSTN